MTEYWVEFTGLIVAILGLFSAAIYRYKQLDEQRRKKASAEAKRREDLALKIKDLQKNDQALEERVDRLSKLCERFIVIQGDAMVEATGAREQSQTILDKLKKPSH